MKTMTLNTPQFITDATGKQVGVLLNLKSYRRMREAEEELADIRAYDAARPKALAEFAAGDFVTLDQFVTKRRRK